MQVAPRELTEPHPASFIGCDDAAERLRVSKLLNAAQRHSHRKSYCGYDAETKEGKCRFQAPWPITQKTHFTWTTGKNGPVGTLLLERNDRWMNSYNPAGFCAWNANMDVKVIYKTECLAEYLCAYVTKTEKTSKQVTMIMKLCQNENANFLHRHCEPCAPQLRICQMALLRRVL